MGLFLQAGKGLKYNLPSTGVAGVVHQDWVYDCQG